MEKLKNIKRSTWVIIAIIAITGYLVIANWGPDIIDEGPAAETLSSEVTESLNTADLGNLDEELKVLDADINKL